jgi:hypothetical protein
LLYFSLSSYEVSSYLNTALKREPILGSATGLFPTALFCKAGIAGMLEP